MHGTTVTPQHKTHQTPPQIQQLGSHVYHRLVWLQPLQNVYGASKDLKAYLACERIRTDISCYLHEAQRVSPSWQHYTGDATTEFITNITQAFPFSHFAAFSKLSAFPEAAGGSRSVGFASLLAIDLLIHCTHTNSPHPTSTLTGPRQPHALQPEPFLQNLSSASTQPSRNHRGSIHHLFSKSPVFAQPPAQRSTIPSSAPHSRSHPDAFAPRTHLTPFIKHHHLLSHKMLGCTVSLSLFRYHSRNNLYEIIYRSNDTSCRSEDQMVALYGEAPQVWYPCIFSHSLPSLNQNNKKGVCQWLLQHNACWTAGRNIFLWHQRFEKPRYRLAQLAWTLVSAVLASPSILLQNEEKATTPLHSGMRLQLLQFWERCFTVPALSTATQNCGRQTKHQTKRKMRSSLGKMSTFQPESANCVPECFELNEACYF